MKRILLVVVCLVVTAYFVDAQQNFTFQGNLNYTEELSDIWGYAPENGKEYALVGVFNGVSIVDVTNPLAPNEVQFIPGPNTVWRDIKVWDDYAYVTNESSGGLLIIDMTNLPASVSTVNYTAGGLSSAHNVFIDENGYAYVVGANVGIGGALILDLNQNPLAPVLVGTYSGGYVHDIYVRGDTMWTAEINNGFFAVVDISNKSTPVILQTQSTPSNFTHNVWLTNDGNTLLTTDEVSSAFVGAYDVSNLNNISQTDGFQSNPGSGVIPHNVFIIGDFAMVSYYRDGVVMFDVTQPDNLIQVGDYDTSPFSGSGFNGCWGVYPYLPSGNVLATDIEGGLFVLSPNYVKACYLTGNVTDANTSGPLNNVSISISSTSVTASTSFTGNYKTGVSNSGLYDITFAKAGYVSQVFSGVSLQNGIETTLNAQLSPAVTFTLIGKVEDKATGIGIPNAQVSVGNALADYSATTNSAGEFAIGGFPSDVYSVIAGKWGYVSEEISSTLSPATNNFVIELDEGFYDDFALDFNWSANAQPSVTSGFWVKGEPIATDFNGNVANTGADVGNDLGDECFMTGNGGGGGGTDDVDNGVVTLISPTFDLSSYNDPYITYDYWFFNDGGSITFDDTLYVRLSNGTTTVTVQSIDEGDGNMSQWNNNFFRVADFINPTANMAIEFEVSDISGLGHIVEAAVDRFIVTDSILSSACSTPDPISSTVLSYNSIGLNWTTIPGAEKYEVRGRALGAANFVTLTIPDGGASSFVVSNLITNVSYEWQIQAVCSEQDSIYSGYSDFDTFDLKCATPLNPASVNVTATSAQLSWDAIPGAQQYNIVGGVVGSSALVSINVSGSATSFDVSGLSPSTVYQWAIRTSCSVLTGVYSNFTAAQTFTTAANKLVSSNQMIGNQVFQNKVKAFPNPADDQLHITADVTGITLQLFDAQGKLVIQQQTSNTVEIVDVKALVPGIYLLQLHGNGVNQSEKLIIY